VSGWIAHAFEQRSANRIIRPQSQYAGARDRKWAPARRTGTAPQTNNGIADPSFF